MSFKTEFNQTLQTNLADKRVKELLEDHIPENEAKLLSNGRFTCLICSYRPIFDTTLTLSAHRGGNRHLHELSKYLKRKEELAFDESKKKQLAIVQKEQKRLGCSKPLSKNGKFFGRKPILECPSKPNVPVFKFKTSSARMQVQKYLKKSSKAAPFDKMVETMRENYGSQSTECNINHESTRKNHCKNEKPVKLESFIDPTVEYELQLKMSGWIKDSSGNWSKDPEAEFDSDEDEAPKSSI